MPERSHERVKAYQIKPKFQETTKGAAKNGGGGKKVGAGSESSGIERAARLKV